MAAPERDPVYTRDDTRTVYTRESNGTGWFVGIIVALALLAIGYLIFSANTGPTTAPAAPPAVETTAPMTEAPVTEVAPPAAPSEPVAPATTPAPAAPAAPSDAPTTPLN